MIFHKCGEDFHPSAVSLGMENLISFAGLTQDLSKIQRPFSSRQSFCMPLHFFSLAAIPFSHLFNVPFMIPVHDLFLEISLHLYGSTVFPKFPDRSFFYRYPRPCFWIQPSCIYWPEPTQPDFQILSCIIFTISSRRSFLRSIPVFLKTVLNLSQSSGESLDSRSLESGLPANSSIIFSFFNFIFPDDHIAG